MSFYPILSLIRCHHILLSLSRRTLCNLFSLVVLYISIQIRSCHGSVHNYYCNETVYKHVVGMCVLANKALVAGAQPTENIIVFYLHLTERQFNLKFPFQIDSQAPGNVTKRNTVVTILINLMFTVNIEY